jgi:hypothetical protein
MSKTQAVAKKLVATKNTTPVVTKAVIQTTVETVSSKSNVVSHVMTTQQSRRQSKQVFVKSTRTKMAKMIAETKGRVFTTTHLGVDGQMHMINGMRYKNQTDPLGNIQVYSIKAKEMRLINPKTLKTLSFEGVNYKA